jgi:SAM-dependent methyltransferase
MDYSFQHYLLAKQSVDDRALNQHVYKRLCENLPHAPIRIVEVGAGIGSMLVRLLRWGLLTRAEYVLVDEMRENLDYAARWLPQWAAENGLQTHKLPSGHLRLFDDTHDVFIRFECSDALIFAQNTPRSFDLLIAHAFLDLLPMPEGLRTLFGMLKPGGLAWLTINFDGVTSLEPVIFAPLDRKIERLYHQTMDTRPTGGDSKAGRHLFAHIRTLKASILAAGASDWIVHAIDGHYPFDEAYFLHFILHFFEDSLLPHPKLDRQTLRNWLAARQAQIESGELVYIAHQTDFLVKLTGG